ncbi:MAG TPA: hypothetical protein VG013_26925 [Gemmataceae bacterium]|jgi:hypothetical protein|nr:hypothetical protein [Gemmataceae bacterium]
MKRFCAALVVASLVAITVGCNAHHTSGGPGANDTSRKKPLVGQREGSFELKPPKLATTLKQGDETGIKIGIDRGKNFDEDVALKFEGLAKGVTITPASPTIKHGDTEADVKIKAADDATVGKATATVVGHPETGPDATSTFDIKVNKK